MGEATHEVEGFLSDWIASFEKRNKRAPSDHSIKNLIVALRSLYRYLNDYGLLLEEGRHVRNPTLPIEPPTPSPKVNDWLRRSEDEALLSACFTSEAEREARSQEQRRLTLIDLGRLVELWIEYSPKLDDADRERLPLKPIYFLSPSE